MFQMLTSVGAAFMSANPEVSARARFSGQLSNLEE